MYFLPVQDCDSDSICDEDFKRVLLKSSYCKKFLDPGQYSFADVPRLKLQVLSTTQPLPGTIVSKNQYSFAPPRTCLESLDPSKTLNRLTLQKPIMVLGFLSPI
jgi:hypothetical protein